MTPKERSEAPVHDITYQAINDLITKHPRKKTLLKEYLREYKLLDLEEMSEDMALELLEIMDSQTYVQVDRAKRKFEEEQQHAYFIDNVEAYLEKHSDKYIILSRVTDCWLLAKRIKLNVYTKNEMSQFQPVERHEDREYFVVIAVKIADEFPANDMIGRFVTRGCRVVRIYEAPEIHSKMEAIR